MKMVSGATIARPVGYAIVQSQGACDTGSFATIINTNAYNAATLNCNWQY